MTTSTGNSPPLRFNDLPLVQDKDDIYRVHQTTGLYFLNRRGKAHGQMTCSALDGVELVANPNWRVATSGQVRALGQPPCTNCS